MSIHHEGTFGAGVGSLWHGDLKPALRGPLCSVFQVFQLLASQKRLLLQIPQPLKHGIGAGGEIKGV